MLAALSLLLLTVLLGAAAVVAARQEGTADSRLVDEIDALLPQTQCTLCGFDGCRPYAEALANGTATIDRCPPGGDAGARALARLLGRPPRPVDPAYGVPGPRKIAWIVEEDCIGCTKCIQACPVDAIVGGPKRMHTVIASECTGCELCVAPCPVDCIEMPAAQQEYPVWKWRHFPDHAQLDANKG